MARGKLTQEQKRLIKEQVEAGIPPREIAAFVSEATGKPVTGQQVNGYKNVLTGVAGTKGRDLTRKPLQVNEGMNPPPITPPAPQPVQPVQRVVQPVQPLPILESATLETSTETPPPAATDGFEPAGARNAADGFPTQKQQMRTEFDVHRKEPNNGYLGRVNSPFGLNELGHRFGDGLYDIDKLVNGRNIGRYADQRVSGFGAPKLADGRIVGQGMPGMPGMPRVAMENPYGQQYGNPYGYGYPGMGPTPIPTDPTAQFRNLHEVADKMAQRMTPPQQDSTHATAVQSSFQFAQALMQNQQNGSGTQGNWLQQWMVQQSADRAEERREERARYEREKKDGEKQRTHELSMVERQHRMDMERQKQDFEMRQEAAKAEFERRKEQDQQFQQTLRSIEGDRSKDQEARVARVEEAAKDTQEAVSKELNDNVETIKTFYEGIHAKDQENIAAERKHNREMFEMQQKHLESQNSNGLLGSTIKDVADKIGTVTDRAMTFKAIERMSPEARDLLKNSNLGQQLLNGNGNGNGNGRSNGNGNAGSAATSAGGGDVENNFGRAEVEKVLKSQFFKTLQEEWAMHVQSGRGATMFTHAFLTYMKTSPNMVLFANFMTPRSWEVMLKEMEGHLSVEVAKVFNTEQAVAFYDDFMNLLVSNVRYSLEYAKKAVDAMQAKNGGAAKSTEQPAGTSASQ